MRRLALCVALLAPRFAGATKECPKPEPAVTTLSGPSRWSALPSVWSWSVSMAAGDDQVFAAIFRDGTMGLDELRGDRWQSVEGTTGATRVAVLGDHIYMFTTTRDAPTKVAFARLGTT